jgi:hypothetical protein
MNQDGFRLVISVVRILNVCLGAALAALLLRATLPVWRDIGRAERWLAVTLFLYSANVALFTPVASNSLIHIGFLASFLAGHRYLYFVRKDSHAR